MAMVDANDAVDMASWYSQVEVISVRCYYDDDDTSHSICKTTDAPVKKRMEKTGANHQSSYALFGATPPLSHASAVKRFVL
eukprot:1691111-Pleurochrysis_carterae.AAC.2